MSVTETSGLPQFLQSFSDLSAHLDEHFAETDGTERGDLFVKFACRFLSLTPFGKQFPELEPSPKKSHDGGVDIVGTTNSAGEALRVQAKFKIRGKDDFDSIISKFKNYEQQSRSIQQKKFWGEDAASSPRLYFVIITSSKMDGIISQYAATSLASREFYDQLKAQLRLEIFDGPRVLSALQGLYRKAHLSPSRVTLSSSAPWIKVDNVRVGIVDGQSFVKLYAEHGDGLFFENIRDFLGASSGKKAVDSREYVNAEITRTVRDSPKQMLERNNGVTFRAKRVSEQDDNSLLLEDAGIVNGCQTTMCLVDVAEIANGCKVLVKVVETLDAWDVAKAANFQNEVKQIDLDLARFLRPQVVKKAAADLGYGFKNPIAADVSQALNTIYETAVDYSELKSVYLGLFSRKPNNIFEGNYAELQTDLLGELYTELNNDQIYETLFLLIKESRRALETCQDRLTNESYAPLVKRVFHDEKPRYRAWLAVVAAAVLVKVDISERDGTAAEEAQKMKQFLMSLRSGLENRTREFRQIYLEAFKVLAQAAFDASDEGGDAEIAQKMYGTVSKMPFRNMYRKVQLSIDGARALQEDADS